MHISDAVKMLKIKVKEFVLTKLKLNAENVLHLLQHTADISLRNCQSLSSNVV